MPRGQASVEVYRSVNRAYSWRVIAAAVDETPEALRAAKALALELEGEIRDDLAARYAKPTNSGRAAT